MTRAAIYCRYSTDLQREASLADQARICKEFAEKQGWEVAQVYKDRAQSGASLLRPGIQCLLEDARDKEFDIIVSEALDRISRDQADIASIHKEMSFNEIRLVTLSEGEIDAMHIGFKGTMNAMFLDDLKRKIRRGMRGRIEDGKSAGGLPYGYDVVKGMDKKGDPITGERKVNEAQAVVVLRILSEYADGRSPRAIAADLNRDKVPGPTGKLWHPSAIHGNRRRGIGILNNEVYVGVLVWNRVKMLKDPNTGRRVSRYNDPAEWIRTDAPELRIVDDDLWERVKDRQGSLDGKKTAFQGLKRPRYLLTGLVKCGVCGSSYVMANHERLGCSNHKNNGTCGNDLKIKRTTVEDAVQRALREKLMDDELVAEFSRAYVDHLNELTMQANARAEADKKELQAVQKDIKRIIQAIKDGYACPALKDEMNTAEARRVELVDRLENREDPKPFIHPGMTERYRREIEELIASLNDDRLMTLARERARSLIDKIVLTPNERGDALMIDLHGDLAGILSLAENKGKPAVSAGFPLNEIQLVAEERLELPTRGL